MKFVFGYYRHKKSFTLIELLVVVGIIGILAGMVIMVINPETFRGRARDANRKKDLSIISAALEQYYADKNQYPNAANITALGTTLTTEDYLKSMPEDPSKAGFSYCYSTSDPFQDFNLCSVLEVASANELNGATNCNPSGTGTTYVYCTTSPF